MNRVTLIGHLGKDAETKQTNTGKSVTNFSVATSESYKDKNGEWQSVSDWHNVVAWDLKDTNLSKGDKVFVEGKLKTRSYEDKSGVTKYITEVNAMQVQKMLNVKTGGGSAIETKIKTDFSAVEDDDAPF